MIEGHSGRRTASPAAHPLPAETDSEISVVGECADGEQALHTIEALKPDLVFLDVQMPERDGSAW